jgi:hypothetical protein
MSEHEETQPYAGPGEETARREDLPPDVADVKQYVEHVDEEVPEESLQERVAEELGDRNEPPARD